MHVSLVLDSTKELALGAPGPYLRMGEVKWVYRAAARP